MMYIKMSIFAVGNHNITTEDHLQKSSMYLINAGAQSTAYIAHTHTHTQILTNTHTHTTQIYTHKYTHTHTHTRTVHKLTTAHS